MSAASRLLQPGDWAVTDYECIFGRNSPLKRVQITERRENLPSQSRINFRVTPTLRGCEPGDWFDADWFEPEPMHVPATCTKNGEK